MKKRALAVFLAAAMGVSLLGGCGNKTAEQTDSSTQNTEETTDAAAAEETAELADHMNVGLYWFGTNLDPAVEYNGWTLCRTGIGETLVKIDKDLQIVGQVADSWEMLDDNTWKFHIRDGVTFQNGDPCDAEAVKASFERVLGSVERAKTSTYISNIETDGDDVIFTTEQPNASFLNAISEPLFTIEVVSDDVDYENQPICTGPFMVTGFETDVQIDLARYDGYWGGASPVETMTVKNVSDDSTRAMALQSGELDVILRVSSADLSLFQDNPDFQIENTTGIRTRTLQFNFENEYLKDINVRKALVACLDYDALAKVLGSDVTVACAPFPLDAYGYKEVDVQKYDKDAATSYLEESGYTDTDGDGYVDKDGKPLELTLTYDLSTMTSVNEAVQDMAKQVGIKLNLNLVESLDDVETNGTFEIKERNVQYLSTGDPIWLLTAGYQTGNGTNYGHYSNAELDELIGEITKTFDQDKKAELVKEAQEILLEDAAGIYMMSQSNIVAANSRVQNITAHPIDYYFIDNQICMTK